MYYVVFRIPFYYEHKRQVRNGSQSQRCRTLSQLTVCATFQDEICNTKRKIIIKGDVFGSLTNIHL